MCVRFGKSAEIVQEKGTSIEGGEGSMLAYIPLSSLIF
jgi:hypothetical protein